jgi:Icc protein
MRRKHDDHDARRFDEHTNTRPDGGNHIHHDHGDDGIDRRGFLRCMAWAGTATVWGLKGGIPTSFSLADAATLDDAQLKSIFFAQISDSHIGFNKAANADVAGTLRQAVAKLNALPQRPAFVLHTGDITQLAKADEFDTAREILKEARTDRILYVPGEHDVATDGGAAYLARYGR